MAVRLVKPAPNAGRTKGPLPHPAKKDFPSRIPSRFIPNSLRSPISQTNQIGVILVSNMGNNEESNALTILLPHDTIQRDEKVISWSALERFTQSFSRN
jgi:hypothetical protein